MIHPEELGSRIAARRRVLGLTQGQVAVHMGVSPQAVSKWERGLACPDLAHRNNGHLPPGGNRGGSSSVSDKHRFPRLPIQYSFQANCPHTVWSSYHKHPSAGNGSWGQIRVPVGQILSK